MILCFLFPFVILIRFGDAQLVSMFSNAVQSENCEEWGDWGPCIWLKGNNPIWQRSYFDQLLPGRKGCRTHIFYKLLRERWGQAFSNVVEYLRETTISREQCGYCSYQQSCGRKCSRRGNPSSINALFVAERLCPEVDQSNSCKFTQKFGGCNFWPNPTISLPNVSDSMLSFVNNIQFLNCLPQTNQNKRGEEENICRCCCAPFFPNPKRNFQCEIGPQNDGNKNKLEGEIMEEN